MRRILEKISFTFIWSLTVPLFISLFIRGILILANVIFPWGVVGDLVFVIILWFLGFLVIKYPTIIAFFSLSRIFFKIDSHAKPPGRTEIINFAVTHFRSFEQELASVLGPIGAHMDKSDMDYFTTTCFRLGSGIYNGIESHLPSEFYDLYPDFLEAHSLNLQKNPGKYSSRILLATRAALRSDYLRDKVCFESFYQWHNKSGVKLLYVHPKIAEKMKKRQDIETTDIGIWEDQYALLFKKVENSDTMKLTMIPKGKPAFDNCMLYVKSLNDLAVEVTSPPELIDQNLASRWDEYINPYIRKESIGKFLLEWLEPYKDDFILDAAAGIGCESVFLLSQSNKFKRVISNELEPTFRDAAKIYARKNGNIKLKLDGYNWLDFGEHYANYQFGAILVLGNSLCLLSRGEREKAIREFSNILKPGGILIIDERNFDYMISNKIKIMDNPSKNFQQFGKSMYYGSSVKGCPIDITPEKIIWACYSNGQEVSDWESLQKNVIGEFELYPFKKGELISLLKKVGNFKDIQTFSDFQQVYNPDAEFFTYIAKK